MNSGSTFPVPLAPMTAATALGTDFSDVDAWGFEMKWDGVRILAHLDNGTARLFGRSGREETERYPEIVAALAQLGYDGAVLDAEAVVTDKVGRPSFALLQKRINLTKASDIRRLAKEFAAQLMVFDLLRWDHQSLLELPYVTRRELLTELIGSAGRVQVPPSFEGELGAAIDISETLELEGVMAKRLDSPYRPGARDRSWLKVKHQRHQEVVIVGWKDSRTGADRLGSLLMAVPGPDTGHLQFVGCVGSGFSAAALVDAEKLLVPIGAEQPELSRLGDEDLRGVHWVSPQLVGEVSYAELLSSNRLRHPVWRGWRPDKRPDQVCWE